MDFRSNDAFQHLITTYFNSATKRGLKFELDEEQFHAMARGNCHYCGVKPMQLAHGRTHSYTYNGIDRVENDKGYHVDNTVSCCGNCNRAKGKMDLATFAEHVLKIEAHLRSGNSPDIGQSTAPLREDVTKKNYAKYLRRIKSPRSSWAVQEELRKALEE